MSFKLSYSTCLDLGTSAANLFRSIANAPANLENIQKPSFAQAFIPILEKLSSSGRNECIYRFLSSREAIFYSSARKMQEFEELLEHWSSM